MFIKIFFLFLSSFYLNLACNGADVLVDRMPVEGIMGEERGFFSPPRGSSSSSRQHLKRTASAISEDEDEDKEDQEQEAVQEEGSPPRAKKARTKQSPQVGPSPHCQSHRPHGCQDPRVLKSSLEYGYGGQITTTTCDAWHDRNLKILEAMIKQNAGFFKRKNAALLGVQLVYEHEGQFHLSREFDINTLFVSGGKHVSEPLDLKVSSVPGRIFQAKSVHNFLEAGHGSVTKQMRGKVLEYYSAATSTKLRPSTLDARRREASFTYLSPQAQRTSKKATGHANSPFERAYLHSEQAILLMLVRMPEVLASFFAQLPAGATVHQVTLLIASKNQMCRQCGACYYVSSDKSGILRTTLEDYIKKFPKKGFKISPNSLNVFPQVSGLNVFDNVHLEHRLRQLRHAGSPIVDSRRFAPHVAQMCLPKQLTRKQRNELEKQQSSRVPKFELPDDDD